MKAICHVSPNICSLYNINNVPTVISKHNSILFRSSDIPLFIIIPTADIPNLIYEFEETTVHFFNNSLCFKLPVQFKGIATSSYINLNLYLKTLNRIELIGTGRTMVEEKKSLPEFEIQSVDSFSPLFWIKLIPEIGISNKEQRVQIITNLPYMEYKSVIMNINKNIITLKLIKEHGNLYCQIPKTNFVGPAVIILIGITGKRRIHIATPYYIKSEHKIDCML